MQRHRHAGHQRGAVLFVEDDLQMAAIVSEGLIENGFSVEHLTDGNEVIPRALQSSFDALILDRMLPGSHGLDVLKALRSSGDDTPTLILSAMASIDDRVVGLRAGADDYLVKPFALAELIARVETLFRKSCRSKTADTELIFGDLRLDLISKQAWRRERNITLMNREFQILELLLRNSGRVVSRAMILQKVWNYHFDPGTNVIEVHISHLRRKIDQRNDIPILKTVRGCGYALEWTA